MSLIDLEEELRALESHLEATQRQHEEQVAASKAIIGGLQVERDRLLAAIEAEKLVAGLTDEQRAALVQKLFPEGIPSGEEVGTPGGEDEEEEQGGDGRVDGPDEDDEEEGTPRVVDDEDEDDEANG